MNMLLSILGIALFIGGVSLSVYASSQIFNSYDEFEKNIKNLDLIAK